MRTPKEKYLIQQYHTEGWKYVNSMAHCYQVTALKTSAGTNHESGSDRWSKQLTKVYVHCRCDKENLQIARDMCYVFLSFEQAPQPTEWLQMQCKCGWTVWRGTACKPIEEHCVCYRHPEDRKQLLSCEDRGTDGWHCSKLRIFPPQECLWHDHASKHTRQDPPKWTKACFL